jgi:hypothetical protein
MLDSSDLVSYRLSCAAAFTRGLSDLNIMHITEPLATGDRQRVDTLICVLVRSLKPR